MDGSAEPRSSPIAAMGLLCLPAGGSVPLLEALVHETSAPGCVLPTGTLPTTLCPHPAHHRLAKGWDGQPGLGTSSKREWLTSFCPSRQEP